MRTSFWQRSRLHGRARRRRLFEIASVNFVYRLKIAEIGEEDRRLDNVSKCKTFGFQDGADIVDHPARLLIDVPETIWPLFGSSGICPEQ